MSVLAALGITFAAAVVIAAAGLLVAVVLGRGIRIADQAAAPSAEAIAATFGPNVTAADVEHAIANDDLEMLRELDQLPPGPDAYVEALRAGDAPAGDDPTLTRMFAAHRDEARDGT